jgi:addiction module HigA family antidote
MLMAKRKPATIGKILVEEFMKPIGLTQGALAEAMGLQRKHVNKLCNDRRNVTAASALILARVFGNSADFCSMCSSAAICGERCTRRVNANGLSARDP